MRESIDLVRLREQIGKLGKVGLADQYLILSGLCFVFFVVGSMGFIGNRWVRSIDPDSLARKDVDAVLYVSGACLLVGGGLMRRYLLIKSKREIALGIARQIDSAELVGLAVDQRSADWIFWILRMKLRETGEGLRLIVRVVHYDRDEVELSRQLYEDEKAIDEMERLIKEAQALKKAQPLNWMYRLIYVIPIAGFCFVGWLGVQPWAWSEHGKMVVLSVCFVSQTVWIGILALITRGRDGGLLKRHEKVLGLVSLGSLALFAESNFIGSVAELERRVKKKIPGAKEVYRDVMRFRSKRQVGLY